MTDFLLFAGWFFMCLLMLSMLRPDTEPEEDEPYRRQYRISNIPMRKRGVR